MTRKAKLEKAMAYNDDDMRGESYSEATKNWMQGSRDTHTNLAPLHAALIEAIENLEDIQAWCRDRAAQHTITNMKCLSLSTEALAKIDKALGDAK